MSPLRWVGWWRSPATSSHDFLRAREQRRPKENECDRVSDRPIVGAALTLCASCLSRSRAWPGLVALAPGGIRRRLAPDAVATDRPGSMDYSAPEIRSGH